MAMERTRLVITTLATGALLGAGALLAGPTYAAVGSTDASGRADPTAGPEGDATLFINIVGNKVTVRKLSSLDLDLGLGL